MVFGFLFLWLQQSKALSSDTLLGVLAHVAMALGIIVISFNKIKIDGYIYEIPNFLIYRKMPDNFTNYLIRKSLLFTILERYVSLIEEPSYQYLYSFRIVQRRPIHQ